MNKHWFYFDNYVYVNYIAPNKVLLYNTLNHDLLTYRSNTIYTFISELKSIENNGIIDIDLFRLKSENEELYNFIIEVRAHYMGDLLPIFNIEKKPIVFQSDPMVLKEEHAYHDFGDSILHNITEMTFYVNNKCSFNCKKCNQYYKQLSCCHKGEVENEELSPDIIISCLKGLQESSIFQINIVGGNILSYTNLNVLVDELNQFSFNKTYKINTYHISNIHEIEFILNNSKNSIELLCTNLSEIEKIYSLYRNIDSLNVKINFLIQSEEDLNKIETLFRGYESNIIMTPFYNGDNYDFFKENIFVSKEEIKSVSFKDIKRNTILNHFFFGALVCMSNGDVYSNLNNTKIGNIKEHSVASMVFKELEEKRSWLKVRKNVEPCNNCLYSSICPPLSNYEEAIGQNNLCTII